MGQRQPPDVDIASLLAALYAARNEMHVAGSSLDLPGPVRFRLLAAARNTQGLIEAVENVGLDRTAATHAA